MEDYKYLFKVVLIGEASVGKTCLIKRFCHGVFPTAQSCTIGVDFLIKTLNVKDEKIKLQIWDTAGEERFRALTQLYYRNANAILIVYDISKAATFNLLPEWLRKLKQHSNDNVRMFLVGNKCDLSESREVEYDVAESFAQRHGMKFIEASAKESVNVEKIFGEIAETLASEQQQVAETDSKSNNGKKLTGKDLETSQIGSSSSWCYCF